MSTSGVTIVTYGGGTNSPAVLIGMIAKKEPPPRAILFADTDGEKPHTYSYLKMFSGWLQQFGYPHITVLKRNSRGRGAETLYESCMRLNVLPSVAYGWKTCSQKYKIEPQDKWCNSDVELRAEWASGRKVVKIIGYDFGEVKRASFGEDEKYIRRYPLIEWKWGRAKCEEIIQRMQLPLPGKSACFFCPHSKKQEIVELGVRYPNLLEKALALEANAKNLKKTKGLGRSFRWVDFIQGARDARAAKEDPFDEIPCGCYDG